MRHVATTATNTQVPTPERMRIAIDKCLASHASGAVLPFAVIAKETGKAVGMTNYLNVDPSIRRLEIGGTWYRKSAQRTRRPDEKTSHNCPVMEPPD
jgi:N-acetyltransferase